jgi:hypothetical protein
VIRSKDLNNGRVDFARLGAYFDLRLAPEAAL